MFQRTVYLQYEMLFVEIEISLQWMKADLAKIC